MTNEENKTKIELKKQKENEEFAGKQDTKYNQLERGENH